MQVRSTLAPHHVFHGGTVATFYTCGLVPFLHNDHWISTQGPIPNASSRRDRCSKMGSRGKKEVIVLLTNDDDAFGQSSNWLK